MLKEEQVVELLNRCESVTNQHLNHIRGNLLSAVNRSAAIWELLVIDAAKEIGVVEYEPHEEGSPDIRMTLPSGEKIWIEIAFLYPRFWKEERQSNEISQWMREEANRKGIDGFKIFCRFEGIASHSGFIRKLPKQHEKNSFLKSSFVQDFFTQIIANKMKKVYVAHEYYTLSVGYSPQSNGGGGGGLVQEAPRHYKEHALYRVVKTKARQHDVPGVRLLCIGSDQSSALSNSVAPGGITAANALFYAFKETTSIAGVITVSIENQMHVFRGISKNAKALIFYNDNAKNKPCKEVKETLSQLDFNRWTYHHSLNKYDNPPDGLYRKLVGKLSMSASNKSVILKIPSTVLLEILAERTSLNREYDMEISHLLSGNYRIVSSSYEVGSPEAGDSPTVILEFELDFDAVFERTPTSKK